MFGPVGMRAARLGYRREHITNLAGYWPVGQGASCALKKGFTRRREAKGRARRARVMRCACRRLKPAMRHLSWISPGKYLTWNCMVFLKRPAEQRVTINVYCPSSRIRSCAKCTHYHPPQISSICAPRWPLSGRQPAQPASCSAFQNRSVSRNWPAVLQ